VYTFLAENKEARKILKTLKKCARKAAKSSASQPDFQALIDQFNLLKEIEKHYARKENQLFPLLEAKKFTGPTQVMWGKHDEIRAMLKELGSIIEKKEWKQVTEQVNRVISAIKKLMFLEEKILFPTSVRKLNNLEWAKIKNGESAIGYAWVTPSNLWDAEIAKAMSSTEKQPLATSVEEAPQDDAIKLSEGRLSPEQIDLMLKRLPFDITFVDENDQVRYYSDTPDRLFPRSPAIIGREVQKCHPPKSVHIVNDIVAKFKAKEKDVAEFWIQMNGKFIHIRYFPVYDNTGNYKGVIEVSQEISGIKKLEGQRRLLDW
ncbi:MAG: PAS domain-containing protein, partial [Candidatus Marinimicrobia bacterium]|nr:PAS domain-containing protein [Candidatus Neomarinimicrobiota bacterium]